MKKLFSIILILAISVSAFGQDKKLRAGLVTGMTTNWVKIQTNKIERNGIGAGFTIGMVADYKINDNIALATGLQFDLESFKLDYGSATNADLGTVFYGFNDTEIYKYDDGIVEGYTDSAAFQLLTRKFRGKYVTLPIFLKFQTNMIGSFSYYGKFGLRTSFLAGVRMDDSGYEAKYRLSSDPNSSTFESSTIETTNENMKPESLKKGLSLARMGVGIYGGSQWNFTGNTFLFAELGFVYGFTPIIYQKSEHLVDKIQDGTGFRYENLDVKSNPQHMFELKVGLLF
ncbi:MAG: outer membrane beta-barrel protein [Crocinitomicaceae bacterium]